MARVHAILKTHKEPWKAYEKPGLREVNQLRNDTTYILHDRPNYVELDVPEDISTHFENCESREQTMFGCSNKNLSTVLHR